ncbi:hypothetical protein JM946_19455 [Steroidobacter sp. S1-65]|uniref:Uncharacterized protein n=1 Tax=Steroidobacter gossypii TaxID=2805490 RepID=A0ABS1X124_9GAMM|nr:hypothetical protein [Steroidobacter gossypii]MBM0106918.1 hypothetical protein [Steroidobacter gossypii]
MIELPQQDPCDICETLAGRSTVPIIAESELTVTVVTPVQFEVGQCCVVTRRHVGTLLDLTEQEGAAVIKAAREVAQALLATYQPSAFSPSRTTACIAAKRCRTTISTSCQGSLAAIGA